jgi:hypothetical protein
MPDAQKALISNQPRYQKRQKIWDSIWNLDDFDTPQWLAITPPSLVPIASGQLPITPYVKNKEMQLQGTLGALKWRDTLTFDDPFIPHLQPYAGVTVFASAFGCEIEFFDHTLPWAHPVIKAGDPPEKVYDLEKPSITNGQLGEMLEFTDYFVEKTGGQYPIAITDLQGPMDTAYLVWDSSEFMMAMYTNPKEVHHLMRLATDLTIDYIKEQRARSPQFVACHYPPLWLPDGQGIAISDDALAVLSPKTYEDFALPYVNEMSEEFGGIFIHSCGNFVHQLDNLEKVNGLRGLNFGASEMPFDAVWERFNGKTAIIPHLGLNKEIHFDTRRDYIEHILKIKTHNRGLLILLPITGGAISAGSTEEEIALLSQEVEDLLSE